MSKQSAQEVDGWSICLELVERCFRFYFQTQ